MGDAAPALNSTSRKRSHRRIEQITASLTQTSPRTESQPTRPLGIKVRRRGVVLHGVLDQKADLWRRYRRSHSRSLQARMVELYLPVVHRMAEYFGARARGRSDIEDLKSAAVLGLLRAIETFDPDRAIPFEGYLGLLVRGAVLDELRRQDWVSREARDRMASLSRARRKLAELLGREPGDWEMARYLRISMAELRERETEAAGAQLVSIEGSAERQEIAEAVDDRGGEPDEIVERREILASLDKYLKPIERLIVSLHYQEGRRLREIARLVGLSESRICQIHGCIIERLKQKLGID